MTSRALFRPFLLTALLLPGAALARNVPEDGGFGSGPLALRVNPAIGAPGGLVAMVLRTYAPRPIRQGQVSIRVVAHPPAAAVHAGVTRKSLIQPVRPLTLLKTVVYSPLSDAVARGTLNGLPDSQVAQVSFQSASASINSADGPLAVFWFRLDPSVAPGDVFDLSLDLTQTKLTDAAGKPITLALRSNTLTVRAPLDPFAVEAEGDGGVAGAPAELGVSSFEAFPVSGGRFTLTWDPRLLAAPPTIRMDPRYGQSISTVDASQPGRLVVEFQSPDSSFNSVPGTIVAISATLAADAPAGAVSPFAFDPVGTWLLDPQGNRIALALADGTLQIQ